MYSETQKPRGALQEKHPLWLMHDELQILYTRDDMFNRGKKVKGKSNSQSNEKNKKRSSKGNHIMAQIRTHKVQKCAEPSV